jgi:hypothetical protein
MHSVKEKAMNKDLKHTLRRAITAIVILIVIEMSNGWAFRPAPAYAASSEPTAERHAGLLRGEAPLCPAPQMIIDYATSHTGKDGEQLYKPQDPARVFTSPQHLYEIGEHYGDSLEGWATDEKSAQAKLRELLTRDLPVIVDVTVSISRNGSTAAHFVLVTGVDADNTVYVNDPYGQGQGGHRREVSWEDFYWAWQNNSDGKVGGHGWWMVVDLQRMSRQPDLQVSTTAQGLTTSNRKSPRGVPFVAYPKCETHPWTDAALRNTLCIVDFLLPTAFTSLHILPGGYPVFLPPLPYHL